LQTLLRTDDRSAKQSPIRHGVTDRLNEAQIDAIVDAYLSGATAPRLATTHDLSLSSVKRILRSAKATKTHI
jgi:hypothetical protein